MDSALPWIGHYCGSAPLPLRPATVLCLTPAAWASIIASNSSPAGLRFGSQLGHDGCRRSSKSSQLHDALKRLFDVGKELRQAGA